MLVEVDPHSLSSLAIWCEAQPYRGSPKLAKSIILEDEVSMYANTFCIHEGIEGVYWHVNLPKNLTISQVSTERDFYYMMYFVTSTSKNKTQANSTYFLSSRAEFTILLNKDIDWTIVALAIPNSLFFTLWDATLPHIHKPENSLFLLNDPVYIHDVTPLSVQKTFVQLKQCIGRSLKHELPGEFLLKAYSSFMLMTYIDCLRCKEEYSDKRISPCEQEVQRIIEIERRMSYENTLPPIEELAREAGMSLTKFRELFKVIYGKPIYDYFLNCRMERSKEFLLRGYSVSQVSSMVGFTKPGNFSKLFKKCFGQSPSSITTD